MLPAIMSDPRLEEILRLLDPPAEPEWWFGGATVSGSLRDVRPDVAAWNPSPERPGIWQYALHIAYWRHVVRSLLAPDTEPFPRSPDDWPGLPETPDQAAWDADRELLEDEHRKLVAVVRSMDSGRLDEAPDTGSGNIYRHIDRLHGIVLHDVYHTGQIEILKRLHASSGPNRATE